MRDNHTIDMPLTLVIMECMRYDKGPLYHLRSEINGPYVLIQCIFRGWITLFRSNQLLKDKAWLAREQRNPAQPVYDRNVLLKLDRHPSDTKSLSCCLSLRALLRFDSMNCLLCPLPGSDSRIFEF